MISDEVAVQAAREAAEGVVYIPEDAEARIEPDGDRLIVEFPWVQPAGTLGPDYYARVTLDAASGKVLDVLGA